VVGTRSREDEDEDKMAERRVSERAGARGRPHPSFLFLLEGAGAKAGYVSLWNLIAVKVDGSSPLPPVIEVSLTHREKAFLRDKGRGVKLDERL